MKEAQIFDFILTMINFQRTSTKLTPQIFAVNYTVQKLEVQLGLLN
ncbi:MAG: hypothetical protein NT007_02140 [Candidatus Kapabacteria bacterium]|nr:hypothetical protein [Candidatus Kapabacteria bacterium]